MISLALPARAAVTSDAPDAVSVTIYHDPDSRLSNNRGANSPMRDSGLALIRESRSLDLPAGVSEIRFRGVSDTMVPQTAELEGLPEKPDQSNFDYDLLGEGRLIAASLGRTVRLVRTDRRTGTETVTQAILRTGPSGVLLEADGKLEALGCSGLPERLVFDSIPEGLSDVPTLTVRITAPKARRYSLTLRYLASGMDWAANYVARTSADGKSVDLSGWITLANAANVGFAEARVDVIAGRYESTGEDVPPGIVNPAKWTACWPTAIDWNTYHQSDIIRRRLAAPPAPAMDSASPVIVLGSEIRARDFGDYKQYPLPEATNVAARQTKQVQFIASRGIAASKIYRGMILNADSSGMTDEAIPAEMVVRLRNDAASGLGKPLPAGNIASTLAGPEGDILLAEDGIGDVPPGLMLEIPAGTADTVWFQSRVTDKRAMARRGNNYDRLSVEVTMVNQKDAPVDFELLQGNDSGSALLVSESRRHDPAPGALAWKLSLQPHAQSLLRYTLDVPKD